MPRSTSIFLKILFGLIMISAGSIPGRAFAAALPGKVFLGISGERLSPQPRISSQVLQSAYLRFSNMPKEQVTAEIKKAEPELPAREFVNKLMRNIEKSGKNIDECRRYEHDFKLISNGEITGGFSADCSGPLGTFPVDYYPTNYPHDKNNYYFRAGENVVVNSAHSWLVKTARRIAGPEVPVIFVPMLSKYVHVAGLSKDRAFQAWTAALLSTMDLLGKDTFAGKSVAIMGAGNGVDAIKAFLLGANNIMLFEVDERAKQLFQQTLKTNSIKRSGVFNYDYFGTYFEDLPAQNNIETDVLMMNLGRFGTQMLPLFSKIFTPKGKNITLILTGDEYAALWRYQKERIDTLESLKEDGFQVSCAGEDSGKGQIIAYVMKFNREQWKAAGAYLAQSEEEFQRGDDTVEYEEPDSESFNPAILNFASGLLIDEAI